jgi:murein DD-endopeptidase MepM/ murein hydrolase activator NlpD
LGKHATILLLTAAAFAGSAGSAPAQVAVGGLADGAPPSIAGLSCRASCAGLQTARPGSLVRVSGGALAGATLVVFEGGRGRRDDTTAAPATTAEDTVDVLVPAKARTGRIRVVGASGRWSKASTQKLALGAVGAAQAPLVQAHVDSKRVFLDGHSRPSVSFFVGGDTPTQVRVDLVHDGEPAPIASWTPDPVPAGSVQSVAWDGALGPVAPPEGRYEFRVTALAGGAVVAAQARAAQPRAAQTDSGGPAGPVSTGFLLLGHAFPIQGAHTIGMEPAQRFGAARDGHTHQGQDVFAACGTPLVAVHSGTIRYKATQAAAGNYVVLREDDGSADYAYMHLRDPALVGRGATVTTGQLLGYVGDTGDADGCHLHFEKWPAPGWYSGGAPVDPLADLQSWDQTS